MDRNQVIEVKTKEKDGYSALQIGAGSKSMNYYKKPQIGHFLKNHLPYKTYLREFKITEDCYLPVGYMVGVRHFTPGKLLLLIYPIYSLFFISHLLLVSIEFILYCLSISCLFFIYILFIVSIYHIYC